MRNEAGCEGNPTRAAVYHRRTWKLTSTKTIKAADPRDTKQIKCYKCSACGLRRTEEIYPNLLMDIFSV